MPLIQYNTLKTGSSTRARFRLRPGCAGNAVTGKSQLKLRKEAELAAQIGYEPGHVNAWHTAEIMSKSGLTSAVVGGIGVVAGAYDAGDGNADARLGMLGSGALLASYSRDNERPADDLGLHYMVKAGYHPGGRVGLMEVMPNMSNHKASAAELLFATHPMSDERYQTALKKVGKSYQGPAKIPVPRPIHGQHRRTRAH